MKCNNCKVAIEKTFSFAIKNNQCPACGRHIMPPKKLAAYISLKELIVSNFPNTDAEKVANLVVANFELKQLFKESSVDETNEVVLAEKETETVEVSEEEMTDKEYDELYKKKQIEEARKLKKMKEDAYEDALRNQYGMGGGDEDSDVPNSDGFFGDENLSPLEMANRMKQNQKLEESQTGMLSGAGGFSRSDV
jgi:hypothetical protein